MSAAGEMLWEPTPDAVDRSQMTAYMRWLQAERGVQPDSYEALWRWSVENIEDFWASIWDYFEVISPTPYSQVLADRSMPGTRWFEGAEISYPEHVFRGRADDDVAVRHASELRPTSRSRRRARATTNSVVRVRAAASVWPGTSSVVW